VAERAQPRRAGDGGVVEDMSDSGEMCQANQNYDLVTDLANAASIALPQSLLNWKPKVAR
jgi:hypothetical protein